MYNNFSSKKTKKVISALLASALVVTSAPISAEAATTKVLGVNKTFTKTATKVSGLSKSEKKIVKVTVNKSKKKVTVKGLKPGKASFKIGSKSYTVKVGAVAIKKKSFATSLKVGTNKKVTVTSSYGAKDTLKWSSSKTSVVKVSKATTTASAKKVATNTLKPVKAGTATITVKSKNTGKSLKVKVTVKAATPATATPAATATTVPTATGSATTTPSVAPTATVSGGATTTPSAAPTATGGAIATPEATTAAAATATPTAVPTTEPTKTPEVTTGGTITVTGAAVSGATIVVTNVSGAAVNIADRLPAGTYTVSVSRDGYIAQTKEVELKDKDAKVVEINLEKMLEVASVKALNRAEIEVTFTKALTAAQETAAKTATNYTVTKEGATTSTTINAVTVSDDAKSVILLLDSTLDNGKTANTVTVSKAIGMFADYTDTKVASEDVNIPQVAAVTAIGNKVIEIEFSEAIKLSAAELNADDTIAYNKLTEYFSVKGTATSNTNEQITNGTNATTKGTTTATLSKNGRVITLTFDSKLATDSYNVIVKADKFQDYANYKVSEVAKKVSITSAETVAKVTSVVAKSREKVAVTFDSAVTKSGSLSWKTAAGQGTTTTAELQTDNKTIVYTFTDANVMKAGTTEFTIKGVVDAYGYTVADTTKTVDVPEETAATATVKSTADNKFIVTFDKVMQNKDGNTAGDSTNKASYSVVDPKGNAVALTNATISVDATKKIVTITTADNLSSGDYTVTVSGVKDTMGVEMTKLVATVAVKDTTRPTVVKVNTDRGAIYSDKKIAITFSEEMATTGARSITSASNYKYGGEALPEKTTLQASEDGKTVIITLPETVVTTKKITIGGVNGDIYTVADAAGNILSDGTGAANYSETLEYQQDAPAHIANATIKAVNENTVRVEVKNATLETVYASDFEYTVDNDKYYDVTSAKLVTENKAQFIEFTIGSTLSSAVDASNVKVRAKKFDANVAYKSSTALGTSLKRVNDGTTGSAEAAADAAVTNPQVSAGISASATTWPFRTALISAEVMNANTIKLTFDGLVGNASLTNLDEIFTVANGTNVTKSYTASPLSDNKSVLLTGFTADDPFTLDTSKAITIASKQYADVPAEKWAYDGNGMKYTENTTGITASVETGLTVMDANAYTTLNGTDAFTAVAVDNVTAFEIKFNQTVEKSSISSTGWGDVTDTTYGDDYNGGHVLTSTAEIATNGDLTFKDVNIGKFSGFTKVADPTASTAKIVISKDLTKIKVIVGEANKLSAYGKVTYTPSTAITSASTDKKITVNTTKVYEPTAANVANGLIALDVALLTTAATKTEAVDASAATVIDLSDVAKNGTTVTITEVDNQDTSELITVADNKVSVIAIVEAKRDATAQFKISVSMANGATVDKVATLTTASDANTYTVAVANS